MESKSRAQTIGPDIAKIFIVAFAIGIVGAYIGDSFDISSSLTTTLSSVTAGVISAAIVGRRRFRRK